MNIFWPIFVPNHPLKMFLVVPPNHTFTQLEKILWTMSSKKVNHFGTQFQN